jgi:putative tricarboxylic transport membrane protein
MNRYSGLIPILALPAIICVYLLLFWNSVKDMTVVSAGYPKLLIVAIACLLPFVIGREVIAWRRNLGADVSWPALWRDWNKVVLSVVALIAYVVLLDPLGAYVSSLLFVVGLAFALGCRRPSILAGLGIGTLLLIFVFARALGVELPGT